MYEYGSVVNVIRIERRRRALRIGVPLPCIVVMVII